MSTSCRSPFRSPRIAGSVIGVHLPQPSASTWLHVRFLASLLAAGTAQRVGVLSTRPQPESHGLFQPLEGLLAACYSAASRLLGVPPARRVVDQRPGVDWFAPMRSDVCSPADIERVIEEAKIGRSIVLLIDPEPSCQVNLNLVIGEHITLCEYNHEFPLPTTSAGWAAMSRTVVDTLIALRVIPIEPSR
ncbi:hypothetical protein [Stomatohabitans albus]|uniref:hypothetical protein n=1 Tax=Stomatohabitans albus TaxID=3110766 RepID=UPI00300C6902